jgi:hypothetical protein
MSSINADNGVTSGITGIRTTADNTGNLALQSNGVTVLTLATNNTATFANNVTVTGTLTTASQGISYSSMPAGSVLQVVQATHSTAVTLATTTLTTTGLTASITPKFSTSKILVLINNPMRRSGTSANGYGADIRIYRNGSSIYTGMSNLGYTDTLINTVLSWTVSMKYLDSPANTSSVTYAMFFGCAIATNQFTSCVDGNMATIQLLEIAG